MTQWTMRREAMTDQGEVKTTELVAFHHPVVDGTLADPGLALSEAKAVLAKPCCSEDGVRVMWRGSRPQRLG
jgi:hypothetical protein